MSDGDRDALVLAAAAAAVLATAVLLCHPSFIRPALFRTSLHLPPIDPLPDTPRTDADRSKTARTKERRRRGKDPLRDILKSGKKLKALSSPNFAPDRLSPTATNTAPASDSPSPAPSSSRSVSSSSRSRTRTPLQDARPSDGEDHAVPTVSTVSDTDQLASRQSELSATHPSTSLPSESAPSSDSSPTPITTPAHISSDLGTVGPPSASKSPENLPVTTLVHSLLRKSSMPDADTPTATTSVNGFHGTCHVPTPRRTPTPSLDTITPPPSVAIQTQLASVRGALEAARQREAQMKAELERYAKELEFMRWESAGWRRRELELQSQVHYLAHQLQTIAASFSPIRASAPLASSPTPPLNGTASSNSSNSSSSANASPIKKEYNLPLPSLNPPQSQIIPPSPQIVPPSGLFSPMSMMHSPVYYGYPPTGGNHYSHFSPQNHPHPRSFPLSPTQQGLMSMFSPNGSAAPSSGGGNSGPSSVPDSSSSAGSLSPGSRVDRGRTKVRGGGWIGLSTAGEGAYNESSDDEENEVNKALADAILKRPGSLRLGKSGSRKPRSSPNGESATDEKSSPSSESQAEFTFPSLSALGNVKWGKQRSADSPQNLEELLETEAQASVVADPQPGASDLPAG
ncbi:hypothetical protein APHAL10511_000222 [Amanita phalloides]|nr:hypothetical protein APHAL10511_000222 [Amanita phalloides]